MQTRICFKGWWSSIVLVEKLKKGPSHIPFRHMSLIKIKKYAACKTCEKIVIPKITGILKYSLPSWLTHPGYLWPGGSPYYYPDRAKQGKARQSKAKQSELKTESITETKQNPNGDKIK